MVWLLLFVTACWGADVYVDARVDMRGDLRIRTTDRRVIVQKKKVDQTKFDRIAISPDKRSVGWINVLRNKFSYDPLPLSLSVFTNGKVLEFDALPAYWGWWFWQGGKQVVSYQETLHGGFERYTLRDLPSGRTVSEWRRSPQWSGPGEKAPEWSIDPQRKEQGPAQ